MSQAAGPISKIGCSPLIIAAGVAVVAAIVGGFFLFASPSTEESTSSTEESTSVDPCSSEVSFLLMDEQDGCVDPWPLTTTSGELWCFEADTGNEVFWFTGSDEDGEIAYGVNDAALAWGDLDIDLIRKDAPEGSAELKVDLEPLLKVGLSLCGNPRPLTDDEELGMDGEGSGMDYDPCSLYGNVLRMDEQDRCVDPWPFISTSGDLQCYESAGIPGGREIVWSTYSDAEGRKWYALNDTAIAEAPYYDYLDVDDIRKDDPDGSNGSKLDLEPLLELGLSLCELIPE